MTPGKGEAGSPPGVRDGPQRRATPPGRSSPWTVDLERSSTAPAAARRFVRQVVGDDDGDLCDIVELLVSELVTNAVVHAASAPCMTVACTATLVRVEVHDDDPSPPTPRQPDADQPGGRGLLLLDRLASDWGWQPAGSGKLVWFEIVRPA